MCPPAYADHCTALVKGEPQRLADNCSLMEGLTAIQRQNLLIEKQIAILEEQNKSMQAEKLSSKQRLDELEEKQDKYKKEQDKYKEEQDQLKELYYEDKLKLGCRQAVVEIEIRISTKCKPGFHTDCINFTREKGAQLQALGTPNIGEKLNREVAKFQFENRWRIKILEEKYKSKQGKNEDLKKEMNDCATGCGLSDGGKLIEKLMSWNKGGSSTAHPSLKEDKEMLLKCVEVCKLCKPDYDEFENVLEYLTT